MSSAGTIVSQQLLAVSRTEQKYVLSLADAAALKERLSLLLRRDENGGEDGYTVRSLYFDSLNQRDYAEKLSGVEIRRKIRLRTYHAAGREPDGSSCKLEMKRKKGSHSDKLSVTVSRDEAQDLCRGDCAPLLSRLPELPEAGAFYSVMTLGCYRPSALVAYDRLAFVHPAGDTRITFDSNVSASEGAGSLFTPKPFMVPVLRNAVILEVKYNTHLAKEIRDVLRPFCFTQTAFSKYAESRLLWQIFDG